MATDTTDRAAKLEEERHLYGLITDDAEAVAIHIREATHHLTQAEAELQRIIESAREIEYGISPHALTAVIEGANFLRGEVNEVDLEHLEKDSMELQELTALVETQAKRLND
jgi:chlorite dismutase